MPTRPMPKVGQKKDRSFFGPAFYSETDWMSGSRGVLGRGIYYHKEIGWYGPSYTHPYRTTNVLRLRVWEKKPGQWYYEARERGGRLMSLGDKKTKKEAFEAVEQSARRLMG